MSHYKVHAQEDNEDLLQFDLNMLLIPLGTGYSPTLWQQGISFMLEKKKKGNFAVDKVRTILLYKVEFNQLNKITGRDCMALAEELPQGVAQEQYGSQKGHSAINQGLNKTMFFDNLRQVSVIGCFMI